MAAATAVEGTVVEWAAVVGKDTELLAEGAAAMAVATAVEGTVVEQAAVVGKDAELLAEGAFAAPVEWVAGVLRRCC